MVISCPECSTRFRVDDGKIPAQGAKIRCARCKHIFAVTRPMPEPQPQVKELTPSTPDEPFQVDEPTFQAKAGLPEPAAGQDADDEDFGFDDIETPEIGGGANDELDPSAFDDDATVSDDEDAFSFSGDYGNVSLGNDADDAEEDEPFSFGEPAPTSTQPDKAGAEEQFSFSTANQPNVDTPDPLAASFEEDVSISDISTPPDDEAFFLNEPEMPAPPEVRKSSSRSPVAVVLLILLLLTLAVLAVGGFVVWKNGPAGIEQLISTLTGQPAATERKGSIRLNNLQGSFITNRKEGELFVIQGVAINNLSEAQAAIQVKGIIFDKSGEQLLQKTIFCGNPISDSDLRKLPYSKLEEIMGNQFGESLANLNVTPNQSIPFTIVFRKLPKTLSEFVVEVADTKPAAQ